MRTKIDRIGIEIEGEFSDEFKSKIQEKNLGIIKGDGSVKHCVDYPVGIGYDYKKHSNSIDLYTAEYNSAPLESIQESKDIFESFEKAADDKEYHWNKSAGFHIHVSFHPKKPPEIFSKRFHDFFMSRLKKKFPEVYNQRAGNSYCLNACTEEDPYKNRNERYRAINFMPAWSRHRTIEFRIWRTAHPSEMFEYLRFTIRTINNFLKIDSTIKGEFLLDENFSDSTEQKFEEYVVTPEEKKYQFNEQVN